MSDSNVIVVGAPRPPAPWRPGEPPLLIDAKRCAELLGISKRSWERLVEHGKAPPRVRLGRLARWRYSDVLGYVERLGGAQEPGSAEQAGPARAA